MNPKSQSQIPDSGICCRPLAQVPQPGGLYHGSGVGRVRRGVDQTHDQSHRAQNAKQTRAQQHAETHPYELRLKQGTERTPMLHCPFMQTVLDTTQTTIFNHL